MQSFQSVRPNVFNRLRVLDEFLLCSDLRIWTDLPRRVFFFFCFLSLFSCCSRDFQTKRSARMGRSGELVQRTSQPGHAARREDTVRARHRGVRSQPLVLGRLARRAGNGRVRSVRQSGAC